MTAPTATPVKKTRSTTIAKKSNATTKPEFAPIRTDKGRLDHTPCGHPRTMKGRTACRAAQAVKA